ncbi:MAG: hypothetical protein ACYC4P_11620 [Thermoanaerobaculia bacterium]
MNARRLLLVLGALLSLLVAQTASSADTPGREADNRKEISR